MTRFRYSYNGVVFGKEPIGQSLDRMARYGYDGFEIVGEPKWYDAAEVVRASSATGVNISSVCSLYFGADRDLAHPQPIHRRAAVTYAKQVIDFAAAIAAPTVIVGPAAVGRTAPISDEATEWNLAIESIQEIGSFAASANVALAIEPWNRYESYMLNRVSQAVELWEATGLSNGGVHGDMFHMNIEEVSIPEAYRDAGSLLRHVHLADTNRAAPGRGHGQFGEVLKVLADIDYGGYITFELIPPVADIARALASGKYQEFIEEYCDLSIRTLRSVEQELWGQE